MYKHADDQRLMAAYADLNAGRYDAARATLESLVSEGQMQALLYLGWMYEKGLGIAVDEKKAADYYFALSDLNDPVALYYAGSLMFRRGDTPAALRSYIRAADMGHPSAAYWASAILDGDGGLQPDPDRAAIYLNLAARGGHVFARRDVAKKQLRNSRGLKDKAFALTNYLHVVLQGFARIAKDADDPRVR